LWKRKLSNGRGYISSPEIRTPAGEKLKRNERNNLRMKEGTVPGERRLDPLRAWDEF
jgi:hypothetical protein